MFDRQTPARLGVVGMGATGVGICVALVRSLIQSGSAAGTVLHIFEVGERLASGVAYGTDSSCHLLNMRASTMSLSAEDPSHFIRWLENESEAQEFLSGPGSYVPRRLFAAYLRENLDDCLRTARSHGIKVVTHRAVVSDCVEGAEEIVVVSGADRWALDCVFLCLGDLSSTNYLELSGTPNYIHSMWRGNGLRSIPADASVGIIGASLTAVDALMQLKEMGHTGHITCLSRKRSLPKVQGPRTPYGLRQVTHGRLRDMTLDFSRELDLGEVVELFKDELEEGMGASIDWSRTLAPGGVNTIETLRNDISLAENGQTLWYSILDATSEIIPLVWRSMTSEARDIFMRDYLSIWAMYRHCIPLGNARRLLEMAETGRLQVLSGLSDVRRDTENKRFIAAGVGAGKPFSVGVDYLVNATGTGFVLERSDSSLIQNMRMRGDMVSHPLGGVNVDFETMRMVREDGSCSDRLFYVGPLTRGVHFYTNSFEMNLRNSERAVAAATTTATIARELVRN